MNTEEIWIIISKHDIHLGEFLIISGYPELGKLIKDFGFHWTDAIKGDKGSQFHDSVI